MDDDSILEDDSSLVDSTDEEMIIVGACRKRKCNGTLLTPLHITAHDPNPIPYCGTCGELSRKRKRF
jgi:hypothetical protein